MMHHRTEWIWGAAVLAGALIWGGCGTEADSPAREQRAFATEHWTVDSLLTANRTPTYEEAVAWSEMLAASDARCTYHKVGIGDVGRPIYALVLTAEPAPSTGSLNGTGEETELVGVAERLERDGRGTRVLVNNAIHPGEPCGVNASLAWAAQVLSEQDGPDHPLRTASWVIVPQYNVGGASRRNCCTRANQNGPEAYGFRGNAANLDLNRDFVKMDSQNAVAFVDLFHAVQPDVFVDTHTSNGADYPYTMTLITTQPDKAGPVLGPFLRDAMEPALYAGMAERGWPTVPYVYSKGETPAQGILGFLETPRYSTGYAALWGVLGFTTEAHMLKPFPERVAATHAFLDVLSGWLTAHGKEVREVRAREASRVAEARRLPVRWELASEQRDSVDFTGYTSRREWSAVTKGTRLKYDRESTWTKRIPFDNRYEPSRWSEVPEHWVVPQAWRRVVERLKANGVAMNRLERDTTMVLEVTWVEDFKATGTPYEGHHPVTLDSVSSTVMPVDLHRGDWVVPSDQPAKRYLAETLNPWGHDAFLVWNFFDACLQRKEYYSSYVFEDTAEELLRQDEGLRRRYEAAQTAHPEWADDPGRALRWLYEQSPHNEGTANRYPVFRTPRAGSQP